MQNLTAAQIAAMTDGELNRAIARARGWRVTSRIDGNGDTVYTLYDETGSPAESAYTCFADDVAWERSEVTSWTTDANALGLLAEMNDASPNDAPYSLWPSSARGLWIVGSEYFKIAWRAGDIPIFEIPASTPARAICEAWLLWKQDQ